MDDGGIQVRTHRTCHGGVVEAGLLREGRFGCGTQPLTDGVGGAGRDDLGCVADRRILLAET